MCCRRSCRSFCQMKQRQRSQDHSHRLNCAAQQLLNLFTVFTGNGYADGATRHTPRIAETFSNANVFIKLLQAVKGLEARESKLPAANPDGRPLHKTIRTPTRRTHRI